MLRYCADIRILADIKSAVFYPPPKVDSTVIETRFKSTAMYGPHDEAMLFAVMKAAFGNRRKTLKNALAASGLGIDARGALERARSLGSRVHSEPREWSVTGADGKVKDMIGCSFWDLDGYFFEVNQTVKVHD